VHNYLAVLTRYLKDKKNVPVVISPNFNPTVDGALLSAAHTRTLFERLFRGTGIDTLLLQDGLGARNEPERIGCCRWSRGAFEAQAYVYERAVQEGLAAAGVQFGVNVESFEFDANACVTRPARAADFTRQRRLVPDGAAMVVSFSLKTLWQALGNPCPP
jgi:hypothetical protein